MAALEVEKNLWKELVGKEVIIIYDDGGRFPSKKNGILIDSTEEHIIMQTESKKEILKISKILRGEIKNGYGKGN